MAKKLGKMAQAAADVLALMQTQGAQLVIVDDAMGRSSYFTQSVDGVKSLIPFMAAMQLDLRQMRLVRDLSSHGRQVWVAK